MIKACVSLRNVQWLLYVSKFMVASACLPRPQETPRFYLAAVEKNREKAWDQTMQTTSQTGDGGLG